MGGGRLAALAFGGVGMDLGLHLMPQVFQYGLYESTFGMDLLFMAGIGFGFGARDKLPTMTAILEWISVNAVIRA
jgi:hypothetical protein